MSNNKTMKNIHVLPTDKPSRLSILNSGKLNFGAEIMSSSNSKAQNIYITNSEEIKEGWHFNNAIGVNKPVFVKSEDIKVLKKIYGDKPSHLEKIILTTDQDLIKDGVQAIDDEFLEWFVKNPSCEEVEVDLVSVNEFGSEVTVNSYGFDRFIYKIIIPKEEPKQELPQLGTKEFNELASAYFGGKPKQETLEEAMNENGYHDQTNDTLWREGVLFGAKWQAERMYSEEDMFEFSQWISHEDWVYLPSKGYWVNEEQEELEQKLSSKKILNMWFEQFKKK